MILFLAIVAFLLTSAAVVWEAVDFLVGFVEARAGVGRATWP